MVLIMKNLKISLLVVGLISFFSEKAFAQLGSLTYADSQFELSNYRLASDEYAKIYLSNQTYTIAHKTATALDRIYSYSESYGWWKKVVGFQEATKSDFYFLLRAGYRSIKSYDPIEDLQGSPYSLNDFEEFGGKSSEVAYRVYDVKPFEELNSSASDYNLVVNGSGVQFFTSNRGEVSYKKKSRIRVDVKSSGITKKYYKTDGKSYYGIYSKAPDGAVTSVQVEGYELYHVSDPKFLSNGKMFFTATPNKLKKRDKVIYPGLFFGNYDQVSGTISEVKPFVYNQTDAFGVISPYLDEEQKRLYFSSDRPGGLGGYDLYYANWEGDMNFSEPVNLGSGINSSANERDPYRLGNEFYFSSDRKGGFGGLDIYSSTFQDEKFGSVTHLGEPINSKADDFGLLKRSDREVYLTSDRAGGKGFDDLYAVTWIDRNLRIYVIDQQGNALDSGYNLQLETNGNITDITRKNGSELLTMIDRGNPHTFMVNGEGYFDQKLTKVISNDQEQITFVMVAVPYELIIYETIIYYDLDKDFLTEQSKGKLDEIAVLMEKHDHLVLKIESHTDSRASFKYNERLSEKRAKSVTGYLEGKNSYSFKDRVIAAWFSKTRLVNDCGEDNPCPEEGHQLNRRSELKLVAFPDKTKSYDFPVGATYADFQSEEMVVKWFLKNQ
jgi:outer membrane protein OmpA-like peptidoglycan-associated protein